MNLIEETRALLELQRTELREHQEAHPDLPLLAKKDLWHLIGQISICLNNLEAPVSLLAKGTVE